MKQAGLQARVKKKKQQKVVKESYNQASSKEEIMRYNNFWSGVEASTLLQNIEIKHSSSRTGSKLFQHFRGNDVGMFDPGHVYKIMWDVFLGIPIMYSVIIVPFRLCFNVAATESDNQFDYFMDALFLLDILFNFNTAHFDQSSDCTTYDRKLVLIEYCKFWFWVDLVTSLPIEDIIFAVSIQATSGHNLATIRLIRAIRLIRLLKLVRVLKLGRLTVHLEKMDINPQIMSVFQLIFQIVLIAHFVACGWFYLSTIGEDLGAVSPTNWVHAFGIESYPTGDKYIASFYWTVFSMLAVGYGDIHAQNSSERLFSIFVMLFGGILFGAVIAQVTRFIETRNPQARNFKLKMSEIKAYMTEKNLPFQLKARALEAYSYYLQRKSSFLESGGLFDEMPKKLLIKLAKNIYEKEIANISLFRSSEIAFVVHLLCRSKPLQVIPGELVYATGDVAEDIIFIMRGIIKITTKVDGADVVAGYSTHGDFIGDFEFMSKSTRIADYRAVTNCNLLSIGDQALEEALADHPDAAHVFEAQMKQRFSEFRKALKASIHYEVHDDSEAAVEPVLDEVRNAKSIQAGHSGRRRLVRQGAALTVPMTADSNSLPERKLEHGTLIRSSLWVDGKVGPAENYRMNFRRINSSMNQPYYRVLKLSDHGQEIITEEPVDAMTRRYLFHPRGYRKNFWDVVVGVLIVFSIITIPIEIGFARDPQGGYKFFEYGMDVVFCLDIVYCMRTAYFCDENDAFVAIQSRIVATYLKSWFFVDFFSAVPFDTILGLVFSSSKQGLNSIKLLKTVRLTRLLKLARVMKLGKYLTRLENEAGIPPAVFDLIRMIVEVFFIGHIVACCWWGACSSAMKLNWMQVNDISHVPLRHQYIASLYWTFATLTTTGYGDILAVNSFERIMNVLVMIVGASVFGYIVANVSALMGSLNQSEVQHREKLAEITEFLKEKQCPKALSAMIIRHFKHSFNQSSAFDEDSILARLPASIGSQISMLEYAERMSKILLFKFIENKNQALYLFKLMSSMYVDQDQYIIKEGERASDIYFFVTGAARVYRRKNFFYRPEATAHSRAIAQSRKNTIGLSKLPNRRSGSLSHSADEEDGKQRVKNRFKVAQKKISSLALMRSGTKVSPGLGEAPTATADSGPSKVAWAIDGARKHGRLDDVADYEDERTAEMEFDSRTGNRQGVVSRVGEDSKYSDEEVDSKSPTRVTRPILKSVGSANDDESDDGSIEDDNSWSMPVKGPNKSQAIEVGGWDEALESRGRVVVGQLEEGDFVGHAALLRSGRHTATVKTISPCSIYVLKRADINRLLKDHPTVAVTLQMALGQAMHSLGQELGRENVRVARGKFLAEIRDEFLKREAAKKPTAKATDTLVRQHNFVRNIGLLLSPGLQYFSAKMEQDGNDGEKEKQSQPLTNSQITFSKPFMYIRDKIIPPPPPPPVPKVSKWAIVRKAVRDARTTAKLAAMKEVENMDEASGISDLNASKKIGGDLATGTTTKRRNAFALAMKAKMKMKIDILLRDEAIFYNSDDEGVGGGTAGRAKNDSHRAHRADKSHPLHANPISAMSGHGPLRSHRSCSDLSHLYNANDARQQFYSVTPATPVTSNDVRPRRQSYPSFDNAMWKAHKKLVAIV